MSDDAKTITFLPSRDVRRMLYRALGNGKGQIPYGVKSRLINEALRDCLTRRGFARKGDQP